MAYEKHTWVSREVVTAAKLNHIEEGIFNAAPEQYIKTASLSNNNKTLTLTKQDDTSVVFTSSNPDAYIKSVSIASDGKSITFVDESDNDITFTISELLNAKQDVISDLTTIRSGAAAGATALQASDIINNATSTVTNKPVSANVAKELKDEIDNLKSIGRYLSDWDSTTGLPITDPLEIPYTYKAGDYYIVVNTGETNYKPNGTIYNKEASITLETATVTPGDYYRFDSVNWILVVNTQKDVSFANIAGNPEDNTNLKTVLDTKATEAYVDNVAEVAQAYIDEGLATKQNTLTAGENITIDENNVISAVGGGSGLPEITKDNQTLKTVMEQGDPKPATSVVTDTKGYGFKRNYTKEELLAFLGDYNEKEVGYFE